MTLPRRRRTTFGVSLVSCLLLLACVAWAVVAQELVPDACSLPTPPPGAQFVQCPSPSPSPSPSPEPAP